MASFFDPINKIKNDTPIPQKPDSYAENVYQNKKPPKYKKLGGTLAPYSGTFGFEEAKHLLNRCLFGYTREQLDSVASMTLSEALDTLLLAAPKPNPPVNAYYDEVSDPVAGPGETWVNDNTFTVEPYNFARIQSFQSWWFGEMLNQGLSIHEKMTLFWHNHFATQISSVNYAQIIYRHHAMLRENALDNFKDLVKKVTLDTGMLLYLNGYKNQKFAPDENYARELQELFTLGKGSDSKYTEEDVREAARLLTGWTINVDTGESYFEPTLHDTGNKRFSSFFNNAVIQGSTDGERELDDLLDMIFQQPEVAKFICRKLYRFFVYYVIDDDIEQTIIEPLAEEFRNNNYKIIPVLRKLLGSEHFFDAYAKGAIIKNPMDYYVGLHKHLESDFPEDLVGQYNGRFFNVIFGSVSLMELGNPPNVAGWEAYWNGPAFHELWINSTTLPFRNQLADAFIYPPGLVYKGATVLADVIKYTESVPDSHDPEMLIEYVVKYFLPYGLDDSIKDELLSILLSGQTQNYYWTVAWQDYLDNKQDQAKKQIVFFRLFLFFKKIMNLAEYQLS